MVQLARDYATRRPVFGKLLKDHPLHMQTLARMEVSWHRLKNLHKLTSSLSSHYHCSPSCFTVGLWHGQVETRGAFLMVMDVCHLLGREESGVATQLDTHLLRLLTPVVKLYTGKQVWLVCFVIVNCRLDVPQSTVYHPCFVLFQAVAVVSEGLESFGGQGYIEDTGLPALLRDAQVRLIW